ncbi:unnamed protein product [Nezara viridula]|uniref:Uncharacterized protein n=1 Tax=Nezara viridula TaxID=85310 RepID=A0A9P0H4X3_NEZVI|nr:unnamed protein product [Nezara viridula]
MATVAGLYGFDDNRPNFQRRNVQRDDTVECGILQAGSFDATLQSYESHSLLSPLCSLNALLVLCKAMLFLRSVCSSSSEEDRRNNNLECSKPHREIVSPIVFLIL